jgi:signal transduction histidine kinase
MMVSARIRLTFLYTLVTIASVAILFAFSFYSLYRTLRQDDLRDMQNRMLGYWAQFQTGGLEALEEDIGRETFFVGERLAMVRVADRSNNTAAFSWPERWNSFNVARLEMLPLDDKRMYELHSPDHDYHIEVAGIWLSEEYHLQLGISSRNRVRLMRIFERSFLMIAAAVAGLGFLVGLLIAGRTLRPIERVTAVARQIVDTGRLDGRVEEKTGGQELRELVVVINAMLVRIERLVDGLRNTVDMVAHDLRTPITRLRARAELALRSEDGDQARTALEETVEQSDEVLRMVNTLLDITEAESGVMPLHREPLYPAGLIREVVDLYELSAEDRELRFIEECPEDLVVSADRIRLRQVLANLVDNAVKYCRRGGTITIRGRYRGSRDDGSHDAHAREGGTVCLSVTDTGIGLDEIELERVWERMYRGPVQPEQSGLGLGLSLVRAVVIAHGGSVRAESTRGQGTTFTVELPVDRRGDTLSDNRGDSRADKPDDGRAAARAAGRDAGRPSGV